MIKRHLIYNLILWMGLISITWAQPSSEMRKVWLFLTDKGPHRLERLERSAQALPECRRQWRSRFMRGSLVDSLDLPVDSLYLEEIRNRVIQIRYASKLLNAVSVVATPQNLDSLSKLPFVREIVPLAMRSSRPLPQPLPRELMKDSDIDYLEQIRQIRVDLLHQEGYHGEGIRIGILDTGFDLDHEAFKTMKVIYKYDVINNDTIVRNETGQDGNGQDRHGTNCLSILGGNLDGMFLGPAWGAEFILVKTEMDIDEDPIEEDYYVQGLEICADSGAAVISTSLGYNDWYDYEDFDGKSTVTAKAVNLLAETRDILVVVAVGNEGNKTPHSLITPSDAFGALAVGAVKADGQIADFSSSGPTYDGRIKPDILARGYMTYHVYPQSSNLITQGNGTSYATPLVAGACALIRQKNPDWMVSYLIDRVRASGSLANQPSNTLGYGLLDAYQASSQTRNVKGYVINTDSMKLENVSIILTSEGRSDTTITNAVGFFSFSASLQIGQLLAVACPGYTPLSRSITDADFTKDFLTITLSPHDRHNPICYPNPASGFFTVQFYQPVSDYHLRLFDVAGECLLDHHLQNWEKNPVFTYAVPGSVPTAENVFSIRPLTPGLYILSILADHRHTRQKLMIK
ncbi:MAG: S8 family serine peptidase [Candidatus Delongbacteria bacterium]|nr:S8 family serine peptidase [Candidatus Delongbacteria bacterium]